MDTNEPSINTSKLALQYWLVIMKHKWRTLSFALFVAACTAIYMSTVAPMYRASATLLIEADQAKAVAFDTIQGADSNRKEYYLTQFEILKSNSIAKTVFENLNLAQASTFQKRKNWHDIINEYTPELVPYLNWFAGSDSTAEHDEGMIEGEYGDNLSADLTLGSSPALGDFSASESRGELIKRGMLKKFSARLTVVPIRKTQLVTISYDSEDPQLAAAIANAVGEAYIGQDLAVKSGINSNAAGWLTSRLEDLRIKLDESEAVLQSYREKENIIDLQDRDGRGLTGMVGNQLEQTSHQLVEAKNEVNQLESMVRGVKAYGLNSLDKLEELDAITSHPVIQDIKSLKVQAKLKVSQLEQTYGSKHPELIAAKSELRTVNGHLRTQIAKLVTGLDKQLVTKRRNVAALEKEYKSIQGQFQTVIGKDNTYQKLVRDVETNRELFNTLLSRSKETSLTSDFNAAVARFTDRAQIPTKPTSLSIFIIVVMAFILTVILHICYVLVVDFFTDNFSSVADVENKLGLAVLGVFPRVSRRRSKDLALHYIFGKKGRQFAEAVRTLRTGLLLAQGKRINQVITVISSQPNEGKTTTATNFAFSLGLIEKTLLIDADMRKPSLANNFTIPKSRPGLADLLAGQAELADCLYHDDVSGITVMPCGTTPSNAQELLSSPRFAQLLAQLKESYQRIIIDTPPIQAVSDSLIITMHTDAVIYVIKSEATKVRLVQHGIRRLRKIDANIVGVVLNNVAANGVAGSDYYYGYYSDKEYSDNGLKT